MVPDSREKWLAMEMKTIFIGLIALIIIIPGLSSAQHIISVNTYSNYYFDGNVGYPVNQKATFDNANEFVVFWVVTNLTSDRDILIWDIYSPGDILLKSSNITLNSQTGQSWAYYYEPVSRLNESGIWNITITYHHGADTEVAHANFTIQTPLKNTASPLKLSSPNLAPTTASKSPIQMNFFFLFIWLVAVGASSLVNILYHKKAKDSQILTKIYLILHVFSFVVGLFLFLVFIYIFVTKETVVWQVYAYFFIICSILFLLIAQIFLFKDKIKILRITGFLYLFLVVFFGIVSATYSEGSLILFPFVSPLIGTCGTYLVFEKSILLAKDIHTVPKEPVIREMKKPSVGSMPHVFISYAKEDQTIADRVCDEMEANNITCWIAPRDIPPAEKWTVALLKAIDTCHLFLLIFSSHANISPYVMKEVERAFNQGKVILSFRVEDLEPNEELAPMIDSRQWLNAFSPSYEQHFPLLIKTVKKQESSIDMPPNN